MFDYDKRMNGFVKAAIGFAADDRGSGVAYVRVGEGSGRVLRVPFSVKRFPALLGREVGYAALQAAAIVLQRRGVAQVRFAIDDSGLATDLREHRDVPAALTIPYVRLGCALNQFNAHEIAEPTACDTDLTARARSEVAMHVAA